MIHPLEWAAYIRWRIEKAIRRIRQFCGMKTQHDHWKKDHERVMAEMNKHLAWQTTPDLELPMNNITCLAGGEEMLRISTEGFWVRGVRVEQDDNEAETVYNAFKAWMAWAQLNRDYK